MKWDVLRQKVCIEGRFAAQFDEVCTRAVRTSCDDLVQFRSEEASNAPNPPRNPLARDQQADGRRGGATPRRRSARKRCRAEIQGRPASLVAAGQRSRSRRPRTSRAFRRSNRRGRVPPPRPRARSCRSRARARRQACLRGCRGRRRRCRGRGRSRGGLAAPMGRTPVATRRPVMRRTRRCGALPRRLRPFQY